MEQTPSDHDIYEESPLGISDQPCQTHTSRKRFCIIFFVLSMLLFSPILMMGILWYAYNQPPATFIEQSVTIEPGNSVQEIATQLQSANIVRSDLLLTLTLRFTQDATQIKAGNYNFTKPQTTFEVAEQLVSGEIYHELVSVTFIEGMRSQDYATAAEAQLPSVSAAEFIQLTEGQEGTLFPETYFVPNDFTTIELVELMKRTHSEVVTKYTESIASQGLTVTDALILASIIEREANTPESMRTVAGIFSNRLDIGMALQADASIEYVLDTPLNELAPGQLATELREVDSPYNTYLYPGLPPTPIGNPGETAIAAVADPIQSEYLYYITGNDGEFYYAETYDQHLTNIARHLR